VVGTFIPSKGDRVAQSRTGVRRIGTVCYADQLQVIVKWDDGGSSSLPLAEADLCLLSEQRRPAGEGRAVAALPATANDRT
jgi:hypothetical protein